MQYVIEADSNKEIIKEYEVDEYGNVNMEYINEELDKKINGFQLFKSFQSSLQIELNINKQLYKNGSISKELYEKVENILLDRIKVFDNILK